MAPEWTPRENAGGGAKISQQESVLKFDERAVTRALKPQLSWVPGEDMSCQRVEPTQCGGGVLGGTQRWFVVAGGVFPESIKLACT